MNLLEHRMGFEPMNTGFADQRVNHFAIGAHNLKQQDPPLGWVSDRSKLLSSIHSATYPKKPPQQQRQRVRVGLSVIVIAKIYYRVS
jgi:hypothetical protein